MLEDDIKKEKKKLVEQLGVFLEKEDQLAPLAARIVATLVLVGKKGCTFDQLVHGLNASKSTISTHLDNLQKSDKIRYYTKSGDRKRYFIINSNLIMNIIDELLTKWEAEKNIHLNILDYKRKVNELKKSVHKVHFDLDFQKDYLVFLEEATAAIQKLKSNIINKKYLTR